MPVFHSPELVQFGTSLLAAAGAPDDIALPVAESLVQANLLGHGSHGVLRIPRYVAKIRDGQIDPAARPRVLSRAGPIARIDGGWGFGQVTAHFGADLVVELARSNGMGCVALCRTSHVGRLGEYVEKLARGGFVGLMMTSGAPFGGAVAPYGGRERVFGTNPIAVAVPVPEGRSPLVADFATSVVAAGKLHLAVDRGEPVPPGTVIDRDGNPTTDPASFGQGGALLPFGAHKGYGLSFMVEILASVLAGTAPASSPEYTHLANPTLIVAWSVDAFVPPDQFLRHVEALCQRVTASQPLAGFDEVLLPGEPEARALARRSKEGIPVPEGTWLKLLELARELGVTSAPAAPPAPL
jgi:LDH2 family malate/lactate/ureidoglycolate dehydrogenase